MMLIIVKTRQRQCASQSSSHKRQRGARYNNNINKWKSHTHTQTTNEMDIHSVTGKSNLFHFIFKMTITYRNICVYCARKRHGHGWGVKGEGKPCATTSTTRQRRPYDILMTMMKRISTLNMFSVENMWNTFVSVGLRISSTAVFLSWTRSWI